MADQQRHADGWDEVNRALERLEQYRVLHPTLAAMRRLVDMVRHDAAFADVHPTVSMASLVLSRGQAKRRVCVAWHEDSGYHVYFVDPPLELSEPAMVHEDGMVRVLREHLDRCREP